MIFRETIVTEETFFNVRFYYYADPNRGSGDRGTAFYAKIPVSKFDVEETPSGRGVWYKLNTECMKEMLGDYWWMENGYAEATPNQQEEEIFKLEAQLEKIKTVKVFS